MTRYVPPPDSTMSRFRPEPGTVHSAVCGICGQDMNVKRDCFGPTSWAGAMSGVKRTFDLFECPNIDTQWHKQATKLKECANSTPSKRLQDAFMEECEEIIRNQLPTKQSFDTWQT